MQTTIHNHEPGVSLSVTQWSTLSNKTQQPTGAPSGAGG
jgi:hypothetical protein